MLQELFRLHLFGWTIPIYGYGLMMVLAFLACTQLVQYLARRFGADNEAFVNAVLWGMLSGIVGARLSHVLENWSDYTLPQLSFAQNFWNAVNIRSGGLTFYGGLILAAPVVYIYLVLRKKIAARLALDIAAPCITLGLAIGRIGCFLNGCCYGAECKLPWAVQFPYGSDAYITAFEKGEVTPPEALRIPLEKGRFRIYTSEELRGGVIHTGQGTPDIVLPKPMLENARAAAALQKAPPVHPAQIYSTITSFLITGILLAYLALPHAGGRVFALMLMLEGPSRFLLEMLRVEPPVLGPFSLSMIIGMCLLPIGIMLWLIGPRLGQVNAV